jgi:hypothetical protein
MGFFSIGMVKNYPSSTRPHKSYGITAWESKAVWGRLNSRLYDTNSFPPLKISSSK